MWKLSQLSLENLQTPSLYTPPAYINRVSSSFIYQAKQVNTVENVTSLPVTHKLFARVKFLPITSFIYKDLVVSTYHKAVNDYSQIDLTDMSSNNSYIFEDNLYQSTDIDTLFINADEDDIYLTIAYEIKNITTFKNIAIFTVPEELINIYLQTNSSTLPQLVTIDFLKQTPINQDHVVTFVYKYKIYDNDTKQSFSILNNFTNIQLLPLLVFSHDFDNYDDLDLVLYKNRAYKRIYSLSGFSNLFDTKTHHGFIINKDYVSILLN